VGYSIDPSKKDTGLQLQNKIKSVAIEVNKIYENLQ
jgi:hypothetical protein